MRTVVVLIGLFILLHPAFAQADSVARAHYETGVRKYNLGRFEEAAEEFQAAYESSGDPALLYNIAQAYRQARNYSKALFFYKTYLSASAQKGTEVTNRAEVEQRIAEAKQLVGNTEVPPARTESVPPPTERVSPPANSEQEHVQKAPAPGNETVPASPSRTEPAPVSTVAPAQPTTRRPSSRTLRIVGAALVSVGAVSIIIGGVMSGLTVRANNSVQSGGGEFTSTLYDTEQSGHRYQSASIALYVIGGISAIGGAIPLALSFRKASSLAIRPVLAPNFAGVFAQWRF